jgi:hypothetical protein
MATLGASSGKERAAVPAAIEGAVRSALKATGWEAEEGAGGTIWRELRALAIQRAGLDPGGSDYSR